MRTSQILNFCRSPFCFTLPHTVYIFSEAGISVDEGARGAILALVARLTDGVGTDSSPSDSSVALDDSSLVQSVSFCGCMIYNIRCSHDRQTVHDQFVLVFLQPSRCIF